MGPKLPSGQLLPGLFADKAQFYNIYPELVTKGIVERKYINERCDMILGKARDSSGSKIDSRQYLISWKDTRNFPALNRELSAVVQQAPEFQTIVERHRKILSDASDERLPELTHTFACVLDSLKDTLIDQETVRLRGIYDSHVAKLKVRSDSYLVQQSGKGTSDLASVRQSDLDLASARTSLQKAKSLTEIVKVVDTFDDKLFKPCEPATARPAEEKTGLLGRIFPCCRSKPVRESPSSSPASYHPVTPVGLHNHGNTCYFNTMLQCLISTPGIASYFLGN